MTKTKQTLLDKIKDGTDSFKELLAIYLIVATVVAILFALFENHSLVDAYWWTFITGLTIGYGDIYPVTAAGQVLTVLWAHFTVLILVPLFVVRLILSAVKDRNEFTHEEQEDIKNTMKRMNIYLDNVDKRKVKSKAYSEKLFSKGAYAIGGDFAQPGADKSVETKVKK